MSVRVTFRSGPRRGRTVDLVGDAFDLGRDPACAVVLDDARASRRHARITRAGATVRIADLGSFNGTYVDGERLRRPRELHGAEEVRIGATTLTVAVLAAPTAATRVARERARPPRRSRARALLAIAALLAAGAAGAVALDGDCEHGAATPHGVAERDVRPRVE
jgi:pSer/pThr/pTyr-binding forkhead associated (FHA) protein